MTSSVQALTFFTALCSSLLPDERNDLLSQLVSDWTEISKPGQSIGLSIRTVASFEFGADYLPAVSQPHTGPPILCSILPLGLEVCKCFSQPPLPTGFLSYCGRDGRQKRESIQWNKDKIFLHLAQQCGSCWSSRVR